MMTRIEIRGLEKSYKTGNVEYQAIKGINLDIVEGDVIFNG